MRLEQIWSAIRTQARRPVVIAALATAAVAAAAGWALLSGGGDLPVGIATGNGRLEARQIDLIARYPGRVVEFRAEEGDLVGAGQIIAILDTEELDATLRAAQARVAQARLTRAASASAEAQSRSALTLAEIEYSRARTLHARGFASEQLLDQRRAARQSAAAALAAARDGTSATAAAIGAAEAEAARIRQQIAEATLVAPRAGRLLYRLAEPGELAPAGAAVATILDLSDIYMTIFLPTRDAGVLALGAPARIVLDAAPDQVLPANVSFVSPEAQFTPRQVETREEREGFMYRVRVRVPEALVVANLDQVKTGLTGRAYVQTRRDVHWPDWLESAFTRQYGGEAEPRG